MFQQTIRPVDNLIRRIKNLPPSKVIKVHTPFFNDASICLRRSLFETMFQGYDYEAETAYRIETHVRTIHAQITAFAREYELALSRGQNEWNDIVGTNRLDREFTFYKAGVLLEKIATCPPVCGAKISYDLDRQTPDNHFQRPCKLFKFCPWCHARKLREQIKEFEQYEKLAGFRTIIRTDLSLDNRKTIRDQLKKELTRVRPVPQKAWIHIRPYFNSFRNPPELDCAAYNPEFLDVAVILADGGMMNTKLADKNYGKIVCRPTHRDKFIQASLAKFLPYHCTLWQDRVKMPALVPAFMAYEQNGLQYRTSHTHQVSHQRQRDRRRKRT